jgi:hypothetical protein
MPISDKAKFCLMLCKGLGAGVFSCACVVKLKAVIANAVVNVLIFCNMILFLFVLKFIKPNINFYSKTIVLINLYLKKYDVN